MKPNEAELCYQVVVNDEEQYSVWPTYKAPPAGWQSAGVEAPLERCLAWIDEHWTDLRPRSLRQWLDEHPAFETEPTESKAPPSPSLVERLCQGERVVQIARCDTAQELREQLERNHLLIAVPGPGGETVLGCRPRARGIDIEGANFGDATGSVRVTATLTLDFEPLELCAVIELESLRGTARFSRLEPTHASSSAA